MSAFSDAVSRYGPIGAGLGIGTLAKYGLVISDGKTPGWRSLMADLLTLGMVGVLAIVIADQFALTVNMKVLVGALCAVSSDRLIRVARTRFEKRFETEVEVPHGLLEAAKAADAVEIPKGPGPATQITVIQSRVKDSRAAGVERLGDSPLPSSRADFDALLGKIDEADSE